MRVLITNNTLAMRAGSELYVRDLATGLYDRGLHPLTYSPTLGEVADELRRATIPVVDDLSHLVIRPDIIHGQHHLETMTALLRFPGVPAVSFCHGWLPWEEIPPHFPRILQYVAVDETCKDRLVVEHGIPEERVRVLLNFVDLSRFLPRSALPQQPRRALIFSNNANESTHVGAVRLACERTGIELDVIGLGSGNATSQPERVLGGYDIVFAKARSALEAMAVGAAVILCDEVGLGPMVTYSEVERLRPLNFGIRTLREAVSADAIVREIARYDTNDAARVSRYIREVADREAVIDEIVALYKEVISAYRSQPDDDAAAEGRAAAAYLRWLAPPLKERDRVFRENISLRDSLNALAAEQQMVVKKYEERERQLLSEASEKERGLLSEIAERDRQLAQIRKTLGWRLLSRYGKVKYGVVLPVVGRVKKLFHR